MSRFHICWPLIVDEYSFTDVVSGKSVYRAHCKCGKKYLTNGRWSWFRVRREKDE